jgi:hypothetical protein
MGEFCEGDLAVVSYIYKKSGAKKQIIFASWYGAIDKCPISQKLLNLVHHCEGRRIPLIIGGDFNAHDQSWGCVQGNARGDTISDFFATKNLLICNVDRVPTFHSHLGSSIIDLTIVNNAARGLIEGWGVSLVHSFSDHRYIKFSFKADTCQKIFKRSPKNTEWESLLGELKTRMETFHAHDAWFEGGERLNELATEMGKILRGLYIKHTPSRPVKTKNDNPTW